MIECASELNYTNPDNPGSGLCRCQLSSPASIPGAWCGIIFAKVDFLFNAGSHEAEAQFLSLDLIAFF